MPSPFFLLFFVGTHQEITRKIFRGLEKSCEMQTAKSNRTLGDAITRRDAVAPSQRRKKITKTVGLLKLKFSAEKPNIQKREMFVYIDFIVVFRLRAASEVKDF